MNEQLNEQLNEWTEFVSDWKSKSFLYFQLIIVILDMLMHAYYIFDSLYYLAYFL